MSKSNVEVRAVNWAPSTSSVVTSMPIRSSAWVYRSAIARSSLRCWSKRMVKVMACPSPLRSLPSWVVHPASSIRASARRRPARFRNVPSLVGRVYPSMTPGSSLPLKGASRLATAPLAGPGSIASGEFEKYEVIRGCAPPVSVSLIYSKLNAVISASRTRQSSKGARRVFITKPVIPDGF